MDFQKTQLENGITVVTDSMPDVRSITVGLWFNVGSRDEDQNQAGLTHFMEHMMFKGTPTRTAMDISMQFDKLGAELNAFTSKEYTCYYARFVDDKLDAAMEILADMVQRSQFSQETIDTEREVVLEEIARSEDNPEDHVYDLFSQALLADHPLGKPVLGSRELVGGYRHEDCAHFHEQHYFSGNLTVAAAGHVDHDAFVEKIQQLFGSMAQGKKEVRPMTPNSEHLAFAGQKKDTEQVHLLYGMPWMPLDDDRRFAGAALCTMMGGSMSSRLFNEVREKRGLVYAIYAQAASYQHAGQFCIYAGSRPDNIEEVVTIVRAELAKMVEGGPTAEEMERTRESICGQLLLGLESTSTRMIRLGRTFSLDSPYLSVDEVVQRYRTLTADDIASVAETFLCMEPTIAVVSPFELDKVKTLVGVR